MWQGQRNPFLSAAILIAQPRCGHSDVKATTSGFAPAGWRISQTEPTGSRGYFTQASRRSLMIRKRTGNADGQLAQGRQRFKRVLARYAALALFSQG